MLPALQQRVTGWLGLILTLAVLLALGGSSAQRVKAADAVVLAVSAATTPTAAGAVHGAGTRQAGSGNVFSCSVVGALSRFGLTGTVAASVSLDSIAGRETGDSLASVA